jgi:ABC-type uncharacterized transport system involved in gliding motility auxiliary subunit
MVAKANRGKYVKFVVYLVAVALVNLAGTTVFFRIDLTGDKIYSISNASRQVVSTLSEPLTIDVFFTENLPAPYNNHKRYLRDLLEEYAIYASKYFNYRFHDVNPDEGELSPDGRANQEMANNYGISPIQIQVIDEDEVKFQKAYMGLVINHGDLIERIPTVTSIERLEYQLTTAIMKLNNKISAFRRLGDSIRITLYQSSSLNQVADVIGLDDLPDLPNRIKAVVEKLNPTLFNKLEFVYVDPSTDPSAVERLENKKHDLLSLKWPDLPEKNITAGQGSVGLVLEHGDKSVVVQLVNILRIPIIGTRYDMVNPDEVEELIGKNVEALIDINTDLGYLAGKGTLPIQPQPQMSPGVMPQAETLNNFRQLVSRNYSIKDIDLADDSIPSDLKTLVIARPTEAFTDYELYQIDQFLMQGKSLMIVLDSFEEVFPPQQQGFGMNQGPRYMPLDTGLEKLLAHYGIRVNRSYVMDKNCFRQELPQGMGGGDRPIYFAPLIQADKINHDLEFMKNINRLIAVRISPLETVDDRLDANIKAHRVFSSSSESWEMRDQINLNPNFIFPPQKEDELQSFPLAYLLKGPFTSYFKGKSLPEKETPKDGVDQDTADQSEPEKVPEEEKAAQPEALPPPIESTGGFIAEGQPGSIFIMASSEMLTDNVIDTEGRGTNAVFIMNAIDALNDREDLANLRSKKQEFNPLQKIGSGSKTLVKTFNIVGLPILVVLFGVVVWFRRSARKKQIQAMFQ